MAAQATLKAMSTAETIWAAWALGTILFAAIIAVVLVAVARKRRPAIRNTLAATAAPDQEPEQQDVWVVVNPVKPSNYDQFRNTIDEEVTRATGRPARWIETTVEDPGTGQTIEALRHNPSLVIAAGGDGTVRAVAAGMAHSRVPMGLLPMGTGNLLARNLGLPLGAAEAIRVALTPTSRRVDLAWLKVARVAEPSTFPTEGGLLLQADADQVRSLPPGREEPDEDEYAYLVIAGVGFDGETMAKTTPELKKKVGWSAYVLSALPALRIERMRATVSLLLPDAEGSPPAATVTRRGRIRTTSIPRKVKKTVRSSSVLGTSSGTAEALNPRGDIKMVAVRARTVLFANCGGLPFAQLAPEARIDDGELDIVAIDTQGGLLGWMYLAMKVFGNQAGLQPINLKNDLASLQFRQTPYARVDISRAYPVQVDGDPIGTARTVASRVDKGALLIRVPEGSTAAIPDEDRRI